MAEVPFISRRSVVHSTEGIVACTQPLAARCGLKVLAAGGNAAVSFPDPTFESDLTTESRMQLSLSVCHDFVKIKVVFS